MTIEDFKTYVKTRKPLDTEEIHRFSNDPVVLNGVLYWDIVRMMFEI